VVNPGMSDSRKKTSAGFWITVAVAAVLVGYPLSFGPACWILARGGCHSRLFDHVYWPIGWCADQGPFTMLKVVKWYALIGSPPESHIELPSNAELDSGILISESSFGRYIN